MNGFTIVFYADRCAKTFICRLLSHVNRQSEWVPASCFCGDEGALALTIVVPRDFHQTPLCFIERIGLEFAVLCVICGTYWIFTRCITSRIATSGWYAKVFFYSALLLDNVRHWRAVHRAEYVLGLDIHVSGIYSRKSRTSALQSTQRPRATNRCFILWSAVACREACLAISFTRCSKFSLWSVVTPRIKWKIGHRIEVFPSWLWQP